MLSAAALASVPPRHKGFALWLLPLCYSKSRVASVSVRTQDASFVALWRHRQWWTSPPLLCSRPSSCRHPTARHHLELYRVWCFCFHGYKFPEVDVQNLRKCSLYPFFFPNSSLARYTLIQPSRAFIQPRSPTPLSSTSFLLNPLCFSVFISIDDLAGFADFNHDSLLEMFVPGFLYTYS